MVKLFAMVNYRQRGFSPNVWNEWSYYLSILDFFFYPHVKRKISALETSFAVIMEKLVIPIYKKRKNTPDGAVS